MYNYSSVVDTHEPDEDASGVLVHVAEPSRARWNHIDDLDSFFSRMYKYHQRHGFFCMLLQEVLELIQFIFIVFITSYVVHGINYPVLFKEVPPPHNATTKVTLSDVVYPLGECVSNFGLWSWVLLITAILVWILKLIRGVYHLFHFWDIKQFYNSALRIADNELDNLTWHEVQKRVRAVQIEQQMCIHKKELTELDIYHRILRQQNYLVAMVNKRMLPPRIKIPFVGEIVYWTTSLRYNIQLLFFWSPWSPFENPWHLREEYKKLNMRSELADQMGKHILWLAVINTLLAPVIFMWQFLYAFFSYAAVIRKEPSILTVRRWSLYGRLYLRHFNELEHELQARLTRAHRPATKYLAAFCSPLGTIISENVGFYATSILAVLAGLSVYDEDVLTVEHVLSIMTILTVAVAILRSMAPDETTSSDLEDLLTKVVQHTHYLPSDWVGQAHTTRVRSEFEHLFQYGFMILVEQILSPIITPYVLWFHVHPKRFEIVDFFRHFTVSVVGVGDVCSFAQMDVRRHGNPEWHEEEVPDAPEQFRQCEDGKVELSLVHFKCTNPSWMPPPSVQEFVNNVQNQSSIVASLSNNQDPFLDQMEDSGVPFWRVGEPVSGDAFPGPQQGPEGSLLYTSGLWRRGGSARAGGGVQEPLHCSRMWSNEGASPMSIREMALSATYLHSVYSNRTEHRHRNAQETTPLLLSNR